MLLFIDTETTGFPDYKAPADARKQPHMVQVGALLTTEDGKEVDAFSSIVRCPVAIPTEASDVHGITDETSRHGITALAAVTRVCDMAFRADMVVAHHVAFDLAILQTAWARHGWAVQTPLERLARFCTMGSSTHIVGLPPTERMMRAGMMEPKPPSLTECMLHFFREPFVDAHDAMADVRACARLYFHLRELRHQVNDIRQRLEQGGGGDKLRTLDVAGRERGA